MRLDKNKFIGSDIVKVCYLEEGQRLSESGELLMVLLDPPGQLFVRPCQLMYLMFEILPVGVLLSVVLPA